MSDTTVLEIQNLQVRYRTRRGIITPVTDVSLTVKKGECLGIAGESGSGKSTLALAVMKLLPQNARIVAGRIMLDGDDLVAYSERQYEQNVWGRRIIMIGQNPHDALNPVFRVRDQLKEILRIHRTGASGGRGADTGLEGEIERIFTGMGIPDISRVLTAYPHQLSGGMKQRILTAMAFFCNPSILIADEPTTALDATIAAQVTAMFIDLMKRHSTSLVYITHDIALLSELADSIAVMYAGEIVEVGKSDTIIETARHPYTAALLRALPSASKERLETIPGRVPDLSQPLEACPFSPRCAARGEACRDGKPPLHEVEPGHWVRCFRYDRAGEGSANAAR